MPHEKLGNTLTVFLIPKDVRHLPHKARKVWTYKINHKCPVPETIPIPILTGEAQRIFKRLFAVISGGENGRIEGVYYVEE